MSPEERAHERALAMVLAGRRDALLLLLGQGLLLSWGWSRGALGAAAAERQKRYVRVPAELPREMQGLELTPHCTGGIRKR